MNDKIRIYPAPDGVPYAEDIEVFAKQGVDDFSGYEIGLVLSSQWEVYADEQEVPIYSVPVTRSGPHSFGAIDLLDDSHVVSFRVKFRGNLRSATILPESLGIDCELFGGYIYFKVDKTCNLLIEINNQYKVPLTLSINPREEEVINKNDPSVLWFEPGLHRIDRINLKNHQIVYIEGGAILQANQPKDDEEVLIESDWADKVNYRDFFEAIEKKNVTIMGRGIIDTSMLDWHARRTMLFERCEHVTVKDVTMIGASHWTVLSLACKNVAMDNLKLFGYRENSDGIDIVSSENVTVSNCFIRTGDDAICVKAMLKPPAVGGKNIVIEKCTVWNDKVRCFGITCETKSDIHDVMFRDCDVIYSFADWAKELGSLCIVTCDSAVIRNIKFHDMRIRHEVTYGIICMIMRDKWSTDENAGHIQDIVFENISIPKYTSICMWGYDAEHIVQDITLKNIVVGEEKTRIDMNLIECNEFTKNITLKE